MIALLHYAFLKGLRDRSMPVLFLIAPAQIAAMLIGYSVTHRHLQYPLMTFEWADRDVKGLGIIIPSVVASISAFWTFRSEVATKAIGSFVMASRPVTVVLALIVFAAATATGGLVAAAITVGVLTAGLPANIALLASVGIIAAVLGASLGALYVTISPQPMMLLGAFIAGIPLVPVVFNAATSRILLNASVLSMVCIAVSTFLLRRRCAG